MGSVVSVVGLSRTRVLPSFDWLLRVGKSFTSRVSQTSSATSRHLSMLFTRSVAYI